jgi:hypothetical protein
VRRGTKYTDLADWEAVRDLGHVDPGPRPMSDVANKPLDALPVIASETLPGLRGGLYSDPEGDARRRRHEADAALEKAGIKPRSW